VDVQGKYVSRCSNAAATLFVYTRRHENVYGAVQMHVSTHESRESVLKEVQDAHTTKNKIFLF